MKKGCLLGAGVIVLPGVSIGEESIIGAGSIVNKDIPDWCVPFGNPAKVKKVISRRRALCLSKKQNRLSHY